MYVEESVGSRSSTVDVTDWEDAYEEIKNIVEHRFDFERVEEQRFRHHKDKGLVVSRIILHKGVSKYTEIQIDLVVTIDLHDEGGGNAAITVDSQGTVITRYPERTSWQRSPIYFALRSLWDKLLYGWARGRWKDEAREDLVHVHTALRGAFKSVSPVD